MTPLRRQALLLELDLTAAPIEVEPDDLLGRLRSRHRPRLRSVLRTLHEAGPDNRVRGLVVKVGGGLPWAMAQELRGGLQVFAKSGKPVVVWAETLGEGGNGTADYVLASAASVIWLQPTGELGLMGVAAETTFLRGALDKLGVEPQLEKRYEYKSAADRIMRRDFTPEHREAVDRVVDSTWTVAVRDIAAGRSLDEPVVRELADRAPLSAEEARAAGLVDRLGYRDEVYAALRTELGDDVQLLFADQWSPRRKAADLVPRRRDGVALVEGHGEIVLGRGRPGPRGRQLGSNAACAALRAARQNDHVRAVLFRVDSPGGSAVASDAIWREVLLTRQAGKPVVVSMGSLAGSGGYYIACPADVIVAQPSTITGSIGVLGGKVVVADLMDKLGLNTGAVEHGGRARMFSVRRGFTDGERERLATMLDRIYTDFVQKVADGRGMTYDRVHEVARGRIWSGADAAEIGLVDTLGGLRDAADLARQRAGLPADAPVRPAVHVPPLARLRRPTSSDDPRTAAATSAWGDLTALATALGLPSGGPLRMPSISLA
jgi:protease-4